MMFKAHVHPGSQSTIAEQASAWALESESELAAHRRADRDVWLSENVEHVRAYQTACAVLASLHRNAAEPEILALRQAALAARPRPRGVRRWLVATTVAAAFIATGSIAWWALRRSETPAVARYATAVGERSTISLADGSIMILNTASTAEVAYSDRERTVRLLQGQALFTVAHGQPEPFRVYASDRVVTAVGTTFDVRLRGERVEVAMLEGTVQVEGGQAALETISAGEALVAGPAEPIRVGPVDVNRVVSWRSGLLTFANTPLAEALAEVNRYTVIELSLADPAIAAYQVSGTFRVGEPERFARTMTELFPLDLERAPDGRMQLVRRHK